MTLLNDQHIVVAIADFTLLAALTRNETGHIVKIDGSLIEMLNWVAAHLNFTYSFLQVNDTGLEPSASQPGLISYISKGVSDLLLGPVSANPQRIKLMDFIQPFEIPEVTYLMPSPKSTSTSLSALVKPFDNLVWACLALSFVSAIMTIFLVNWYVAQKHSQKSGLANVMTYVTATLLDQPRPADSSGNKSKWIHLVAGTWCIASFILTNCYSTLLISFVTMPNSELMINSVEELPQHPEIRVLMDAEVDNYVDPSSQSTAFFKYVFDKFRSGLPASSCLYPQLCADEVKRQGSAVYITDKGIIIGLMNRDFHTTKKCNFRMGQETILTLQTSWTLPKGSPYLEEFNKEIMLLSQFGLKKKFMMNTNPNGQSLQAAVRNCQKMTSNSDDPVSGLTLDNLMPVFIVQLMGVLVAVAVLFLELKISKFHPVGCNCGRCHLYINWI